MGIWDMDMDMGEREGRGTLATLCFVGVMAGSGYAPWWGVGGAMFSGCQKWWWNSLRGSEM